MSTHSLGELRLKSIWKFGFELENFPGRNTSIWNGPNNMRFARLANDEESMRKTKIGFAQRENRSPASLCHSPHRFSINKKLNGFLFIIIKYWNVFCYRNRSKFDWKKCAWHTSSGRKKSNFVCQVTKCTVFSKFHSKHNPYSNSERIACIFFFHVRHVSIDGHLDSFSI